MRNLPADLTNDGLRVQLEPFLKRLNIDKYTCEKPKKKKTGKIVFSNSGDGQRFLRTHGQEVLPSRGARPRFKSNLHFMETNVYCTRSTSQPQELALKSIIHSAEQRPSIVEEQGPGVSFNLTDFSCGYCAFVEHQLAYFPEVHWSNKGIVRFTKRSMIVNLDNKAQIRISLKTVVDLVWSNSGLLTLTLSSVPLFFSNDNNPVDAVTTMFSATNLTGQSSSSTTQQTSTRLCSLGREHSQVVGQCLVYQFNVPPVDLPIKLRKLEINCELAVIQHSLLVYKTFSDAGSFPMQLLALKDQLSRYTQNNSLPFGILFQLQALAYNAYLPPSTVLAVAKELHRVGAARRAARKGPISVDAVRKLFDMIDWPSPHGDPWEFRASSLVAALEENQAAIEQGVALRDDLFRPRSGWASVHRATVTPTRVTLHGPEMEPNNRILRRFPNHHDYFIRVQFCDENNEELFFNQSVNCDDVFARFKRVLRSGIQIAGRTYTFLGFSHSSLRSHSVWVGPLQVADMLAVFWRLIVPPMDSSLRRLLTIMAIFKRTSTSSKPWATSPT